MTRYFNFSAFTLQPTRQTISGSLNVASARNAGYTEAGIRSIVTSMFSAAR